MTPSLAALSIDRETPSASCLCQGGQAGSPKAGLRMGSYKVLAWCYSIKGIGGGNVTGPVNAPKGSKAANIDPEFTKGPVLYNLVSKDAMLARKPQTHVLLVYN